MMSLIEAAKAEDFPLDFALVLANKPEAGGIDWAKSQGIDTLVVDHRPYKGDREAHEKAIHAALVARNIEFIVLAGYMRVMTPFLVEAWSGKMINIHPSLLPDFKGLHTHQRAIEAGVAEAGCSVHWVSSGVDEGAVIAQARVPILQGDSEDSLAARVLVEEHRLYPQAIRAIFQS